MGKQLSKRPSKNTEDKLDSIKKKIDMAHDYFSDNRKFYHKFRQFLYQTSITEDDNTAATENDAPSMTVNITEAYVSHFLGQLSLHEPSFEFSALTEDINYEQVKLIESYVRYMMSSSSENSWQNGSVKEAVTGGFSVARVYTDYINDKSFDQCIKIEKMFDPTLTGFDPLAREPHKGDAKFCYFFTPMIKEDFESQYPDIDLDSVDYTFDKINESPVLWYESGSNGGSDIIYVCDYYEKEPIKVRLNLLANPESQNPDDLITLTDKEYSDMKEKWIDSGNPNPFPEVIDKRVDNSFQIIRYRLIGETMIEDPVITDYHFMPLFFSGW